MVIFQDDGCMDIKAKKARLAAIRRANLRLLIDLKFETRQVDFATAIGRPPDYISRVLGGKKNLGEGLARDVESIVGLEPFWLDQERNSEGALQAADLEPGPDLPEYFRRIPIVGTAQLGNDGYWVETGYPVGIGEGFVEFVSRDINAYVLRVRGQSMAPAIRSGNLVVVEPNSEPMSGDYAVVCTRDGMCAVKEFLYRREGVWHFRSVNDAYESLALPEDEITKVHPVGAILPGSKFRPW